MTFDELVSKEQESASKYQELFGLPEGGFVLRDLINYCGKDSLCFDPDQRRTDFMLGARSVALYIMDKVSGNSINRLKQELGRKT